MLTQLSTAVRRRIGLPRSALLMPGCVRVVTHSVTFVARHGLMDDPLPCLNRISETVTNTSQAHIHGLIISISMKRRVLRGRARRSQLPVAAALSSLVWWGRGALEGGQDAPLSTSAFPPPLGVLPSQYHYHVSRPAPGQRPTVAERPLRSQNRSLRLTGQLNHHNDLNIRR